MSTALEVGEMVTVATGMQGVAAPSRRTMTLYDLIAALQDVVGPDDTLVVATVAHLLRSGRCTWGHRTEGPLPAALAGIPGAVSRNNGLVIN
jgi:hypothetical protein